MKEKLNEKVLEFRDIPNKVLAIREEIINTITSDLQSLLGLEVEDDTFDDAYEVRLVFFNSESRITVYFDCDLYDYLIEDFNEEKGYSEIVTRYFNSVINF